MFIASVCLSVCLKPKFGRLKTKFDDDARSAKRPRKTKFGPKFYVFYLKITAVYTATLRFRATGLFVTTKIRTFLDRTVTLRSSSMQSDPYRLP